MVLCLSHNTPNKCAQGTQAHMARVHPVSMSNICVPISLYPFLSIHYLTSNAVVLKVPKHNQQRYTQQVCPVDVCLMNVWPMVHFPTSFLFHQLSNIFITLGPRCHTPKKCAHHTQVCLAMVHIRSSSSGCVPNECEPN